MDRGSEGCLVYMLLPYMKVLSARMHSTLGKQIPLCSCLPNLSSSCKHPGPFRRTPTTCYISPGHPRQLQADICHCEVDMLAMIGALFCVVRAVRDLRSTGQGPHQADAGGGGLWRLGHRQPVLILWVHSQQGGQRGSDPPWCVTHLSPALHLPKGTWGWGIKKGGAL